MDVEKEIERLRREIRDLKDQINRVRSPRVVNNHSYLIPFLFRQNQGSTNKSRIAKDSILNPDYLEGIPCVRDGTSNNYKPLDPAPDPLIRVNSLLSLGLEPDFDEDIEYDFYGLCMMDPWEQFWLISPPYRTVEDSIQRLAIIEEGQPNFPGYRMEMIALSIPYVPRPSDTFITGTTCSDTEGF